MRSRNASRALCNVILRPALAGTPSAANVEGPLLVTSVLTLRPAFAGTPSLPGRGGSRDPPPSPLPPREREAASVPDFGLRRTAHERLDSLRRGQAVE